MGWSFMAIGWLVVLGCAKEGMPGGGPLDTQPPQIVGYYPSRDAVGVDPGTQIWVEFSEGMDKKSVEEALVVTPTREHLELRWKGRRLAVRGSAFPTEKTCVVTLLARYRDSRGNPAGDPFAWAFSTGDSLATGALIVRLGDEQSPAVGSIVRATGLDDSTDATARVAQADSAGVALVGWMDAGPYRVVGFVDSNGDLAYQFGGEAGVEDTAVVVAGDTVRLAMQPAVADTAPPVLVRAVAPDSRRVDLSFSEAVQGDGTYRVAREGGGEIPVRHAYIDPEQAAVVHVILDREMASVSYRTWAAGLVDMAGLALTDSQVTFEGTSDPDAVAPEMRTVYVYTDSLGEQQSEVWTQVRVVWSEPVDVPHDIVSLRSVTDGHEVSSELRETNPQETVLVATEPLQLGEYVVMRVEGPLTDLSGNRSDVALTTLLGPSAPEVPVISVAGSYIPPGGA